MNWRKKNSDDRTRAHPLYQNLNFLYKYYINSVYLESESLSHILGIERALPVSSPNLEFPLNGCRLDAKCSDEKLSLTLIIKDDEKKLCEDTGNHSACHDSYVAYTDIFSLISRGNLWLLVHSSGAGRGCWDCLLVDFVTHLSYCFTNYLYFIFNSF